MIPINGYSESINLLTKSFGVRFNETIPNVGKPTVSNTSGNFKIVRQ